MLLVFDSVSNTNEPIRFIKTSATIITGSRWEWWVMPNNRMKSKPSADWSAGMADPARARAALERLAEINMRCSADVERVLREAQELRRELIDDARISDRDTNS
jgi:hypothetical protein